MEHTNDTSNNITMPVRKHRARNLSVLVMVVLLSVLVMPANALDEPYALSTATASHHYGSRLPIGYFITVFLLIGQAVAAFSTTLVGPAMGITSVLWLIMRNDNAISPKASWM